MAQCLGHRFGTGCLHRSRNTQMRDNWEKWQLCYRCARKLHPEFYKGEKNHGVKTSTDGKFNKIPFGIVELPEIE